MSGTQSQHELASNEAQTQADLPRGEAPLPSGSNVARRLTAMAAVRPGAIAVAMPLRRSRRGRRKYAQLTFGQLDQQSDRLAMGLRELGVTTGMRLALLVRPSLDFYVLVFALFKAGAVTILIDPGMGMRGLVRCLREAEPQGFIGPPVVQFVRRVLHRKFPRAQLNVTVGSRWYKAATADARDGDAALTATFVASANDPAAIIFTTGSTGPPKGVLYHHGTFDHQVEELRAFYGIEPGEIDLPGFPLFGLFNAAMGVTTVLPDMDPTRPARVDPAKIVEAVRDWQVTQAFGSPAMWNRVGPYCQENGIRLNSLRRVLSAGAPVPPHVLAAMKASIHPDGSVHTPYGATEALPVASISASEVLGETSRRSSTGAGTCVGKKFPRIEWRIIRIADGPIARLEDATAVPRGEIGEIIVSGPVVTREYVTRGDANALAKIVDGKRLWHRMGDVGYLDDQDRFWFCGRLVHRVGTASGPMYSVPCEAIFNNHPNVYRSALVGIGPPGAQRPVIIVEPWPGKMPRGRADRQRLMEKLRELARGNPLTAPITDFLIHPALPVDIRHNAKIFREKLAAWATLRMQ